jgi:hypothetical protein
MGYVADWNRQNMKKTGSKGPTTKESRKDLGSLFHSSPAPQSKAKPVRLADGDTEETYKARGLQASANDKVGFFERLRMGNIDQEGSEAYNRFGAGRAKGDDAQTARERARFDRQAEVNRPARSAARDPDDYNPVEAPKSVEAPKFSANNSGNRESVSDFPVDQKDYRPISVTRQSLASPDEDFPPLTRNPAISGPFNTATGVGTSEVGAADQTKMGPENKPGAASSAAGSNAASAGSSAPARAASGNRPGTNAGSAATTTAARSAARPADDYGDRPRSSPPATATAARAVNPNRPDTKPVKSMADRQREARESMDNLPIVRAGRAVVNALSGNRSSSTNAQPASRSSSSPTLGTPTGRDPYAPSIYAGRDAWERYRAARKEGAKGDK